MPPRKIRQTSYQIRWYRRNWPTGENYKKNLRAAMVAGGRYWIKKILKQHFTHAGARKYHYEARSRKYLRRRDKRGKPPLVLSGLTRTRVRSRAVPTARVGGKRGTRLRVKLSAPKYINYRPETARELTAGTQADLKAILEVIAFKLERLFESAEGSRGQKVYLRSIRSEAARFFRPVRG